MVPDWDLKRRLSPVILLHDLLFFFCFLQPSKKNKSYVGKGNRTCVGRICSTLFLSYSAQEYILLQLSGFDMAT
jgi:hypothetical protein